MRITITHGFFLPVPPAAGGAMEKMWWTLAREFAARGHEVRSLSRRWPGWPDSETREGVRCLRLPGSAHTRRLSVNLLLDALWSFRLLRRLPPADILVTNNVLLPALASRLRPSAGRVVVNLNRMPKGQLRVYGRVARIQVPSTAVAVAVARSAPALVERVEIFPNVIACGQLAAARRPAPPGSPVRLGYIGRLHPEKGLELLVRAARLLAEKSDLPRWTLLLRGPGDVPRGGGGEPFLQHLRDLAAPLFTDGRLAFAPAEFDPAALADAYGALDIFAYPSLAASGETFGVSVAEAMASGAAPVVSDLPCFTDLVTHERNGLVFARAASDPAAGLADALARLIRDPARREELAAAARRDSARCDLPAVADAMLEDFNALLAPG
jgi:glycosyltransferase involved in cell wall biosynthesis